MGRGIEKRIIFRDGYDRRHFLDCCERLFTRYRVVVHSYCLMPNHYHLLVETPLGKLHRFMQELIGEYSQFFNRRHERIGPLFQGRYKALLVERDSYASAVGRYIHLNPVKAGVVKRPEDFPWSSYRAYIRMTESKGCFRTGKLLSMMGGASVSSRKRFTRYTLGEIAGDFNPFSVAYGGYILGSRKFVKLVKKDLTRHHDGNIARLRELQKPLPAVRNSLMKRIRSLASGSERRNKLLVYGLRHSTTLSLGELAKMVNAPSAFAVSQTLRRLKIARKCDDSLDGQLVALDKVCRHG